MELKSDNLKMIIPAAGFGRRVGSPQSKEMLLGPDGRPLISYALELAHTLGIQAHVISRTEKTSLKRYIYSLVDQGWDIFIQEVEPTKDWAESLLKSEPYWGFKNVLVLPDTRWSPENGLNLLIQDLQANDLVYATFEVGQDRAFGFVQCEKGKTSIVEKPVEVVQDFSAWGIVGLSKQVGKQVFEAHVASTFDHQLRQLPISGKTIKFDNFLDLTRKYPTGPWDD